MEPAVKKADIDLEEEDDPELEYLRYHPLSLNVKEMTPELLAKREEYQAIQSLIYDQPPNEIAENFLNQGELCILKAKKNSSPEFFDNALWYFTQGIETKSDDIDTKIQLYKARMFVNIHKKNFGKVKEDSEAALKLKENADIYYYLALSRFQVDKWSETIDICKKALLVDSSHNYCKELMKASLEKCPPLTPLMRAILAKEYRLGKNLEFLPPLEEYPIRVETDGSLVFPVVVLYDEHQQLDLIQEFKEGDTFLNQLGEVLAQPADWDPDHQYNIKNVELFYEPNLTDPISKEMYVETSSKKHIHFPLKTTLKNLLENDDYVMPGYPVIKVVRKNLPEIESYFKL